jgi:hypothetical protein
VEGALLRPDGDEERLRWALDVIFEHVKPSRLLRPRASFQWLIPIEQTYDEARNQTAKELFGAAGSSVTDWSSLLDGELAKPVTMEYRAQFGIVEAAEAPSRLSRQQSQVTPYDSQAPATLWPVNSLPEVAFFYDGYSVPSEAPEPNADGVFRFLGDTQGALHQLMSDVMDRCGLKESPSHRADDE